jgi:allantoicase
MLTASFAGLVDLAAERMGGRVLAASDEFFAEKENLLKAGRGVFIEDRYTERGKWMDGWETRRKRGPGHDWCLLQLGLPGVIHGVDVDTNHFLGNAPSFVSLEAATSAEGPWMEILARAPVNPGSQNLFAVTGRQTWTHLKLHIYPDGGVARFRVYGAVTPDPTVFKPGALVDLAALENGGCAVGCSDAFFSSMNNLLMPGRSANMGDGWETRRRRGPGHDWVLIRLGHPGTVRKIEVDTNHFKGNFPDACSLDGCYAPGQAVDALTWPEFTWTEILPCHKLQAHTQHYFDKELLSTGAVSHVRLNIYPDGGISRLRILGHCSADRTS